jgi:hypothetical protein
MSDLLNSASLVMIPSGYKEDVVYSQIPTDGSGDLSFTRASNGTRVNSAGLVEVCPWNVWEGSNNFSATYWQQYQLTPTTGTTTDIYGNSSTVYKLIGSVTNSYSFINRSSNGSTNTAFSVYAKPNGYTKIGISNRSGGAWNFVVDLVTKVVSNIDDSTSAIVSINVVDAVGDWKRIEVVVSSAVQYNLHPLPSNFNSTNFDNVTLNGTDGVWVMASQVNIGSTAKPYFPTTDRLNVPRLTYQNGGGGCPSLLLEKQSTNLVQYSENLAASSWTTSDNTRTANYATSPDGTTNATRIIPNTNNAAHPTYQVIVVSAATSITAYAKADGYNFFQIYGGEASGVSGSSARFSVVVNLSTFAVDTIDTISSSQVNISNMGNGWAKITINNFTQFTSGNYFLAVAAIPSSGLSRNSVLDVGFAGNGASGVLTYGIQVEQSSYATSLINTTSASATRVADACFKTGISSLIGQTEGTLFADVIYDANILSISGGSDQPILAISDGTFQNYISLLLQGSNDNRVIAYCITSGVSQALILSSAQTSGTIKIAVSYNSNYFALFVNGVKIGQDTSISIPATNSLNIGSYLALGSQFNTNLKETALWKVQLTDAECIALTTL